MEEQLRRAEISVLLDNYGQLLTEKQYSFMRLHYDDDVSLGEIAERYGISRQAVRDSIIKGEEALIGIEQKVGMVKLKRTIHFLAEKLPCESGEKTRISELTEI